MSAPAKQQAHETGPRPASSGLAIAPADRPGAVEIAGPRSAERHPADTGKPSAGDRWIARMARLGWSGKDSGSEEAMRAAGISARDARRSKLLAAVSRPVRRGPERRSAVLGAAAASFIAIFTLREIASGTGDAISLLYVIPIALVSLELGLRAGLVTAAAAVGAVAVWMASRGLVVNGLALIVRSAIFLSVAAIAGRFSDRMRAHSRREERLLRSGLDLAQIGDAGSLAQVLAEHVRLCTEAGSVRVELEGGPVVAVGEQAGETIHVPIASRGVLSGTLTVSAGEHGRFASEDRLMIETIALQAAVACENQRLLAVEREQAELHSEMERMRRRLGEQLRNASHVLERHERERRGIARQLHEEAAQAMAAALITVASLERGVEVEVTRSHLEDVRGHMKSCIEELRRIAGSLRPHVLDEMGLASALQRISELEAEAGRTVSFAVHGLPQRLPREVETSTYRVIEALLDALAGAPTIEAELRLDGRSLRILCEASLPDGAIQAGGGDAPDAGAAADSRPAELAPAAGRSAGCAGDPPPPLHSELMSARAHVELIGGSLAVSPRDGDNVSILADIPVTPEGGA